MTTFTSTAGNNDFVGVTDSITFQPGESGPKSVKIELIDDLILEPTEVFTVSLTSSPLVTLGHPATVKIIDNDGK